MDSLSLLLTRQSMPHLQAPAPEKSALNNILAAGMRAPDHGGLKPWHFTVIENEGLTTLSDLFVSTLIEGIGEVNVVDEAKLAKVTKMPFRAPMIIVISTRYQQHDKVPQVEQLITAGCCAHAMQMAAFSLGYGAVWRTGELAYNEQVKAGLSISPENDLVGFLYIGTPKNELMIRAGKPFEEHVSYL
jgi:nitroreductase